MNKIFYADLHIHSKYSRATSKKMELEEMSQWCFKKGIHIIATGDFTHPAWIKELEHKLVQAKNGLYVLKQRLNIKSVSQARNSKDTMVYFIPATEISFIYSKNKRCYRIHLIVIAPNLDLVKELNQVLGKIGNLKADGRPILGLDVEEFAKIVFTLDSRFILIPAHIWTPWFSLFGSRSGFDSIEECFGEQSKKIFALETGLSSDPIINWQWSALDKFQLISNSDAHSLEKIGREANAFTGQISFNNLYHSLKTGRNFAYTIEFYPEEGKYHYTGHRLCKICLSPKEAKKYKGICPKCKKPLTIGVAERADQLADCVFGRKKKNFIPYKNLIPLATILSSVIGVGEKTKTVEKIYNQIIDSFENEINALLNVNIKDLTECAGKEIAQAILAGREGRVEIKPGFDGEYGKVSVKSIQSFKKVQIQFF